jgi:hypothetical protein
MEGFSNDTPSRLLHRIQPPVPNTRHSPQLQERFGVSTSGHELRAENCLPRAALADYIANKPVHQPSPHPDEVTLMQGLH